MSDGFSSFRAVATWPGLLALAGCILASCEPFQYSPYQTNIPANRSGLTARHLEHLAQSTPANPDSFRFAVLGDPGQYMDPLREAVDDINARKEVDFVLVAGDLTHFGLRQEFFWLVDQLEELTKPYLAVIGNHDAIANGQALYRRVFGPFDFSFAYGNAKFVIANTNRWEFGSDVPDFPWIQRELADRGGKRHLLVLSHSAPFSDAFDDPGEVRYRDLMREHNVLLSMHGHSHSFSYSQHYGDGIDYVRADDLGGRNYLVIEIAGDSAHVERRWY